MLTAKLSPKACWKGPKWLQKGRLLLKPVATLLGCRCIARRCRDDLDFRAVRYPYEQTPSVSAFNGGFFEHQEIPVIQWRLRKELENHGSMPAVCEYETHYIIAAGYWMAFHHAASEVRQKSIDAKEFDEALKCDIWSYIVIRYGLWVVGLRAEFYKLAQRDLTHAKIVVSSNDTT